MPYYSCPCASQQHHCGQVVEKDRPLLAKEISNCEAKWAWALDHNHRVLGLLNCHLKLHLHVLVPQCVRRASHKPFQHQPQALR